VQGKPARDQLLQELPDVVQHGLECVLVAPLAGVEGLLGILILWRRSGSREFDAEAVGVARRSASLRSAALERDSLQQKLQERKLMERAKGILQARRRLSEHQAYLFLRSESRRRRVPLVDLAREIIETQFGGRPRDAPESTGSGLIDSPRHPFLCDNRSLQTAVRGNQASFPSQVPSFGKSPMKEIQWRLAVLYFVRGWSHRRLARRLGVSPRRCGQVISEWRIHAVRLGYVEDIRPGGEPYSSGVKTHIPTRIALSAAAAHPETRRASAVAQAEIGEVRVVQGVERLGPARRCPSGGIP
jgi:hypothetical protein